MIDWELEPRLQDGEIARAVASAGPGVDVGGLAGREGSLMLLGEAAICVLVVVDAAATTAVAVEGRERGVDIDLALAIGGLYHGDGNIE